MGLVANYRVYSNRYFLMDLGGVKVFEGVSMLRNELAILLVFFERGGQYVDISGLEGRQAVRNRLLLKNPLLI